MANVGRPRLEHELLTGDEDFDRAYLKFLLDIHDLTQTDVARDLGMTSQAISGTINRQFNLKKVLDYLANLPKKPDPDVLAKVAA